MNEMNARLEKQNIHYKKMIKLSIDGITSFSYRPLKLASYLGVLTAFIGFIYLIIVLFQRFFTDTTLTGWTSIIILQLVFGGTILFILGLIGEYIGRIYDEVKDRPLYIIEEENGFLTKNKYLVKILVKMLGF